MHSGQISTLGIQRPNTSTGSYKFRLVLLGDMGVGKSCLALRFVRNQFVTEHFTTVGAAFVTQSVVVDDNTVKFEIWDTAGQERFHSLAPLYYRGADAAIVVYDVTERGTFDGAKQWIKELQLQMNPNTLIALTGNKADLESKRMVEFNEGKAFSQDNNLLFMETSAKTAMNVNEIFLAIARKLPKKQNPTAARGTIDLTSGKNSGKSKCSC